MVKTSVLIQIGCVWCLHLVKWYLTTYSRNLVFCQVRKFHSVLFYWPLNSEFPLAAEYGGRLLLYFPMVLCSFSLCICIAKDRRWLNLQADPVAFPWWNQLWRYGHSLGCYVCSLVSVCPLKAWLGSHAWMPQRKEIVISPKSASLGSWIHPASPWHVLLNLCLKIPIDWGLLLS